MSYVSPSVLRYKNKSKQGSSKEFGLVVPQNCKGKNSSFKVSHLHVKTKALISKKMDIRLIVTRAWEGCWGRSQSKDGHWVQEKAEIGGETMVGDN